MIYGVFAWTRDGYYPVANALAAYRRKQLADLCCNRLNNHRRNQLPAGYLVAELPNGRD